MKDREVSQSEVTLNSAETTADLSSFIEKGLDQLSEAKRILSEARNVQLEVVDALRKLAESNVQLSATINHALNLLSPSQLANERDAYRAGASDREDARAFALSILRPEYAGQLDRAIGR